MLDAKDAREDGGGARLLGDLPGGKQFGPDWALIISAIREALSPQELALRSAEMDVSARLMRHYEQGGEPNYPRGEAIVTLWVEVTGRPREAMPLRDFQRGHRAERRERSAAPRLQHLPDWPPAAS